MMTKYEPGRTNPSLINMKVKNRKSFFGKPVYSVDTGGTSDYGRT
jgi:hypothetical protein